MVRNFISEEANIVLKIYKTLKRSHIENYVQAWASMMRHGNWNVILKLNGIQRVTKIIIKKTKIFPLKKRTRETRIEFFASKKNKG